MSALQEHHTHPHAFAGAETILDQRGVSFNRMSTRGLCDLVLHNATLLICGDGGALYSVDDRQLNAVTDCGPADPGRDARLSEAASATIRAGHSVVLAEPDEGDSRTAGDVRAARLAVPCRVDGGVVAVMVMEGIDHFVCRPFSPVDLRALVEDCLSR
jgi:hypothetical protein